MLTLERLKEVLSYNAETGIFIWIKCIGNSFIDSVAGHYDGDGYLRIQIDGKIYRPHRLAWLYIYGYWPKTQIDHKDTNKTNNKISNLREANGSQQKFNTKAFKNNKLGVKGIRQLPTGQYEARITSQTKGLYSIGKFNTLEEAKIAYATEAQNVHGEYIHNSVKEILNEHE